MSEMQGKLDAAQDNRPTRAMSAMQVNAMVEASRFGQARFWRSVDQSAGEDACWPWKRPLDRDGYGQVHYLGSGFRAHRIAFCLSGLDIPEGHQIDHLCRNRACVNPKHLEPVLPRVNLIRGDRVKKKTECKNGHAFTGATRVYMVGDEVHTGNRCRICDADRRRKYQKDAKKVSMCIAGWE